MIFLWNLLIQPLPSLLKKADSNTNSPPREFSVTVSLCKIEATGQTGRWSRLQCHPYDVDIALRFIFVRLEQCSLSACQVPCCDKVQGISKLLKFRADKTDVMLAGNENNTQPFLKTTRLNMLDMPSKWSHITTHTGKICHFSRNKIVVSVIWDI